MTRPSVIAYLFGNVLTLLAFGLFTLYAGYAAVTGTGSGWVALIMLAVTAHATNCNRQIEDFADWKREWDAMNGQPPRPTGLALRWLRYPLGLGVWATGLAYAPSLANDPDRTWMAWLYWLGSLVMVGMVVVRRLRKMQPKAQRSKESLAVYVCPSMPIRSVTVGEIYSALPGYCQNLLKSRKC